MAVNLLDSAQSSLWLNDCATSCDLWDVCGGSRSAPCGCFWIGTPKAYKCDSCHIICLERESKGFSIQDQLKEGLDLDLLDISHKRSLEFPTFIPLGTHESSFKLNLSHVAVDLRTLVNQTRKKPVSVKEFLKNRKSLIKHLKVNGSTKVMGIFNAKDWILEGFWGMGEAKRLALFKLLKFCGFTLVTAPTFSMTYEDNGYPASHNVLMQRRHHRVLYEMQHAGLEAVPNLYWRNDHNIDEWINWLEKQENLKYVSRDFSLTKPTKSFKREFNGLIKILFSIGKPLHVFLVGVGKTNGAIALRELAELGCTGSVISSYPTRVAISKGFGLNINENGSLVTVDRSTVPNGDLVSENIKFMGQYLDSLDLPLNTQR